MNIYWQELKYYRRSVIVWIFVLCVVLVIFLSEYQSISSQVDSFKDIVSHYPKALLAAINFRFEIFYTIYGFFGYILTFIWLAGAIQAMNYGTSVLSKEVSNKTADFILSKPISRSRMLTEKFLAVFTLILITNIFFSTTALVSAEIFSNSPFSIKTFLMLSASLFFVQLFFLALGFLCGAVFPKIKTVISLTLPTVFGLFIIASFGGILDKPVVYYFTPFKYFDPVYIFQHGRYDTKYLYILAIFVTLCLISSFLVYIRKDIEL